MKGAFRKGVGKHYANPIRQKKFRTEEGTMLIHVSKHAKQKLNSKGKGKGK